MKKYIKTNGNFAAYTQIFAEKPVSLSLHLVTCILNHMADDLDDSEKCYTTIESTNSQKTYQLPETAK